MSVTYSEAVAAHRQAAQGCHSWVSAPCTGQGISVMWSQLRDLLMDPAPGLCYCAIKERFMTCSESLPGSTLAAILHGWLGELLEVCAHQGLNEPRENPRRRSLSALKRQPPD